VQSVRESNIILGRDQLLIDIRFVCAVPALDISTPRHFRTYPIEKNQEFDCAIWEAARATSAAPRIFKSIKIGREGMKEEFVDAGLGCNNPVKQLIEEAEMLFDKPHKVSCIVSLGTGELDLIGFKTSKTLIPHRLLPLTLMKAVRNMATDSKTTAKEMEKRFSGSSGLYYRLNVQRGLEDISLKEWESLSDVKTYTERYLREISGSIDEIVAALVGDSAPRYTVDHIGR
jgi:predicted acylesterase/phospholipase RssA